MIFLTVASPVSSGVLAAGGEGTAMATVLTACAALAFAAAGYWMRRTPRF